MDYLGTKLCLTRAMECEVDYRVSRAWAKFGTFRGELLNKKTNLYDRVKLFHAVVTPCALYGCGSWALKKVEEDKLKVAQRRMLRAILGRSRHKKTRSNSGESTGTDDDSEVEEVPEVEVLESWQDWLSRTTQEALEVLKKVGAEDWLTLMHRRKWRWAEKVVNHEEPRWTVKILLWIPTEGARCVGHPKLRWLDSIQKFAASRAESSTGSDAWLYLLRDHKKAGKALPHFVHFCIHGL